MKNMSSFWLFLIGLGSHTQFHFIGSIGISEFAVFIITPLLIFNEYAYLRRNRVLLFFWLSIFVCIGCCIASWVNQSPCILFVKGFATPYSVVAFTVVLHRLLRDNLGGLKWILIGIFLSSILCVFVFQPETYTFIGTGKAEGEEAFEMMITHPLFWTSRISALTSLPVVIAYLSTPTLYSATVPVLNSFLKIMFSMASGRSAAFSSLMSAFLIVLGRKSRGSIAIIGKQLPILLLIAIMIAIVFKGGYSYAAKYGWLGDDAYKKYLRQTSEGTNFLDVLMAGRKEFFVGGWAALDRPLIGYGPKAEDTKGYYEKFLYRFGSKEDYDQYIQNRISAARRGFTYHVIPTHSHIICAWVEDGIAGLIFWLYVLWLIYKLFRKYLGAIPQWFGYFCCIIPNLVWDIFFSPFGSRLNMSLGIVCILLARAVYEGRIVLPIDMEMEIRKYER